MDVLHTALCAAGYNLRRPMRAVLRLGMRGFFARCILLVFLAEFRRHRVKFDGEMS